MLNFSYAVIPARSVIGYGVSLAEITPVVPDTGNAETGIKEIS